MEEQTNTTEQVQAPAPEAQSQPVAEVPGANPPNQVYPEKQNNWHDLETKATLSKEAPKAFAGIVDHLASFVPEHARIENQAALFPVLGSIVVYIGLHQAEAHAAIVTHVYENGTVDLFVFEKYPGNGVARTKVPYSVDIANHTYRWPFEYQPSGLR